MKQPPLFPGADDTLGHGGNIRAPYQAHSPTSAAAAGSLTQAKLSERAHEMLGVLRLSEMGCTDEELQDLMRLPGNTERPLRVGLHKRRMVKDSGFTRPCRSGKQAVVWIIA